MCSCFFFKQKTAYEMRISDWSSDVCSSDLQHVRVGQHAMVGGMSAVAQDVIPYGLVVGNRAQLTGLNLVGLKRRGFSRPQIHALRGAYRQQIGRASCRERVCQYV